MIELLARSGVHFVLPARSELLDLSSIKLVILHFVNVLKMRFTMKHLVVVSAKKIMKTSSHNVSFVLELVLILWKGTVSVDKEQPFKMAHVIVRRNTIPLSTTHAKISIF